MPGKYITTQQVKLFMTLRNQGAQQQTAAAKAGFSTRTAHRIEQGMHQPHHPQPRTYRTRPDPLADVWDSELLPLLRRTPGLKPMTLWEHLQKLYPGQYPRKVLRTLERRVREWLAVEGPPQEVMFRQEHLPGAMGLSDFTKLKQAVVTIGGQPFTHLLYHFRLAFSGWSYVQVVQGGESFAALSEGLQNALWKLGGCPTEHRTDSLSAAFHNLLPRTIEDLTLAYDGLCLHYRMAPSRNNRGKGHENGSVESPHGHFKRRLVQAMLLRGSFDFASVAEYQTLIEEVIDRLNALHQSEVELERVQLSALPDDRYADYRVVLTKVSSLSTICVRCILYSVPSQLIGQTLRIHLYHDRLVGYLGCRQVFSLGRVYVAADSAKRRARSIDYRHVIDSLHKKPRAFAGCQYRNELLPDEHYRQLWSRMAEHFDRDTACKLMVSALYLAAKLDCQAAVGAYLENELSRGTLSLSRLRSRFEARHEIVLPHSSFDQHPLEDYDALLPAHCGSVS